MNYLLPILAIFLQLTDLIWTEGQPNPYCVYNKTIMIPVKVNKTREVKQHKPWYKKLSKPSTVTEQYEDEELVAKVITERACCEGYNMSALQLCEPICSEGCPDNSKCVEPEVCKCKMGYYSTLSQHDRKHYCEPICGESCPENGMCVRPNVCACRAGYKLTENRLCIPQCPSGCVHGGSCIAPHQCQCAEGYKADKGTCVPHCSLGDECKNGECMGSDVCRCNFGYTFNHLTHKCEPNLAHFGEDENDDEDTSIEITTELIFDMDYSTFNTDEDEEGFTEYTESPYEGSEAGADKCPQDFILYRGLCQPLKFALDEIDCRLESCGDLHAHCTENGTCACNEGYRWFRKSALSSLEESKTQAIKPICITLEEYKAAMQLPQDVDVESKENENASQNKSEHSDLTAIFFVVLGVFVMTCALAFLGYRLIRSDRGQLDVEGSKQLSCAYDNRVASDAEKSII